MLETSVRVNAARIRSEADHSDAARIERSEKVDDAMKVLFAMSVLMSAFLAGIMTIGWLLTGTVESSVVGFFVAPVLMLVGAAVCGLFANIFRKE